MLSREQSRAIDRHAIETLGIPGIVLMENAGRGCAEIVLSMWQRSLATAAVAATDGIETLPRELRAAGSAQSEKAPLGSSRERSGVVICCGPGNNGGDGFVIARHLWLAGIKLKIILFASPERYKGDAQINLRIVELLELPVVPYRPEWDVSQLQRELANVDGYPTAWIVDAILGLGATGELSQPIRLAVEAINASSAKRLAVDLPTGLDCDTGLAISGAVKADVTCTFVARKKGFENPAAWPFLGTVMVVGIGAPVSM